MVCEGRFVHYRTGHQGVDDQNWNLFQVMNQINEARQKNDQQCAIDRLDELVELVREHIQYEEAEMTRLGYPFSKVHAREHVFMIESVLYLDKYEHEHKWQYKRDEITSKIETMLLNHIDHHDVQFGNWLKEQQEIAA